MVPPRVRPPGLPPTVHGLFASVSNVFHVPRGPTGIGLDLEPWTMAHHR